MEELRKLTKHSHFTPVILFVVMALAILVVVTQKVQQGSDPYNAKASRDATLTAGDDALSLEQDLKVLSEDPTLQDEEALNAYQ